MAENHEGLSNTDTVAEEGVFTKKDFLCSWDVEAGPESDFLFFHGVEGGELVGLEGRCHMLRLLCKRGLVGESI
jgi:hypothetical protein